MLRTKFFTCKKISVGEFAILASDNSGGTTRKYTFLTDSYINGTSLIATANAARSRWAYGNASVGYFGPGNVTGTATVAKYVYSSNTSVLGGGLTNTSGTVGGAALSTSTFGIIAITGSGLNPGNGYTNKYTYSTDTAVRGTSISSDLNQGSAVGNASMGVFAQGDNTFSTDTYIYSGDVVAVGAALPNRYNNAKSSMTNATYGIFITITAIAPLSTVSIYTFASNTAASSTALDTTGGFTAGCGTDTSGLVLKGTGVAGCRYNYSNGAVTAAAAVNITPYAAIGNGIVGVNV